MTILTLRNGGVKMLKRLQETYSRNQNIYVYYLLRMGSIPLVVAPITERWQQANMSLGDILLLQAIFAVAITLLEIPSGALSDIGSRKKVLAFSTLAQAAGVAVYGMSDSFTGFAIAEITFGIGLAFQSGTDSALVYDTLLELERESEAQSIFAHGYTLMMISNLVYLSLGGILGSWNRNAPFVISTVLYLLTVVLVLGAHEPARRRGKSMRGSTFAAAKTVATDRVLLYSMLVSLALSVSMRMSFWSYQPVLYGNGLDVAGVGFVLSGLNLAAAVISYASSRIKNAEAPMLHIMVQLSMLLSVGAFVVVQGFEILVLAMFLSQISRWIMGSVLPTMRQKRLGSEERATASSLISAVSSLSYALAAIATKVMKMDYVQVNKFALALLLLLQLVAVFMFARKMQVPARETPSSPIVVPAGEHS